jgi:hypothetical protein
MALTPTDMLKIQSAIDAYERRYPRRPSPTAAEALAWQANKRGFKLALVQDAAAASAVPAVSSAFRRWLKRIGTPHRTTVLSLK